MRNISFMLTPEQIQNRTKTVTRRLGWKNLKAGTVLRAVRKGMGLKKGEKVEQLALIRVVDVRQERLLNMLDDIDYGIEEVEKEGLADHNLVQGSPWAFMDFFCASHRPCDPTWTVTRIEFEYVDA